LPLFLSQFVYLTSSSFSPSLLLLSETQSLFQRKRADVVVPHTESSSCRWPSPSPFAPPARLDIPSFFHFALYTPVRCLVLSSSTDYFIFALRLSYRKVGDRTSFLLRRYMICFWNALAYFLTLLGTKMLHVTCLPHPISKIPRQEQDKTTSQDVQNKLTAALLFVASRVRYFVLAICERELGGQPFPGCFGQQLQFGKCFPPLLPKRAGANDIETKDGINYFTTLGRDGAIRTSLEKSRRQKTA
jgi:hypothetical protein